MKRIINTRNGWAERIVSEMSSNEGECPAGEDRALASAPHPDEISRAQELLNYLYCTKGMTLVLGGKTISVPHFDTLSGAGAKEISNNEFAQRITGNYGLHFYCESSWKTDHAYIAHFGMFANGPVDWSSRLLKLPPVPVKLKLQPGVLLPSGTLLPLTTFSAFSSMSSAPSSTAAPPC
eukprot:5433391-Pleurochrysis_carterae.AAC.3